MKKPLKIITVFIVVPIILFLLLIIAYYSFLFVDHDFNTDFLKIDSCLDAGGRWNYESKSCER